MALYYFRFDLLAITACNLSFTKSFGTFFKRTKNKRLHDLEHTWVAILVWEQAGRI